MKLLLDANNVIPLDGDDAIALLRVSIRRARQRILLTQFVTDARPSEDHYGEIRYLLHALCEAAWRGLDVRVILSRVTHGSTSGTYDINEPVARFLLARNVHVRRYSAEKRPTLHAKMTLFDDDLVIISNTNWTPSGFRMNSERSLAVDSEDLSFALREKFENIWERRTTYYE